VTGCEGNKEFLCTILVTVTESCLLVMRGNKDSIGSRNRKQNNDIQFVHTMITFVRI